MLFVETEKYFHLLAPSIILSGIHHANKNWGIEWKHGKQFMSIIKGILFVGIGKYKGNLKKWRISVTFWVKIRHTHWEVIDIRN